MYSQSWNGSFPRWQRGEIFTIGSASNAYTADRTIVGAGHGGDVTVTRLKLDGDDAEVGNTINNPRDALQIFFNTAPTSGEGRPGYPTYTSHLEMRHDDVELFAGKTVTVSTRVRTNPGQTFPFHLYASQGLGATGSVYAPSNTISGSGKGIDRSASHKEIFYRSAQKLTRFNGEWGQYSTTFKLDNLEGCTKGPDNVLSIGVGMDSGGIAATERLEFTCLKIEEGEVVQPWREWPEPLLSSFASANYQPIASGIHGQALNATTVQAVVPLRETLEPPAAGIYMLPGAGATFLINGVVQTAVSPTMTLVTYNQYGAIVNLSGFSGMTPGDNALYVGGVPLIAVSIE